MSDGICKRCGGPTAGQPIFENNHRSSDDCIAFLKRQNATMSSYIQQRAHYGEPAAAEVWRTIAEQRRP